MVDLLILDIDGTIKAPMLAISDSFYRAAARARSAGLPIAICTGRPLSGLASELAERLGPGKPHVFQGGALIANPSGAQEHADCMPDSGVRRIIAAAAEQELHTEIYLPLHAWFAGPDPHTLCRDDDDRSLVTRAELRSIAVSEPVLRIVIMTTSDTPSSPVAIPEGIVWHAGHSVQIPGYIYHSYTVPDSDKGSAVGRLCRCYGVDPIRVMAAGDDIADIPMLEAVGYPLVPADARVELTSRFPVVGTCAGDAAVEVIERALELRGDTWFPYLFSG